MTSSKTTSSAAPPLGRVSRHYLSDETALVGELAKIAAVDESTRALIRDTAAGLVDAVRRHAEDDGGIEAFLQQYDLSSQEGVLLMCIAEALLRIPDADTADRLIADKLTLAKWSDHIGESDSLFVNASTWGLMLTGQMLKLDAADLRNPAVLLGKVASRVGEPVVRTAMRQAMRIMGRQFVMGRTIEEALERSASKKRRAYRYSFDMLGEAALTSRDADRYFESYGDAIEKIGESAIAGGDIFSAPSISVKLSALHPRFVFTQHDRVVGDLTPRLLELAREAREAGIALTVDAEEAHRLELSLEIFERVYRDSSLKDYEGLGLAVQSYQRRAMDVVRYLLELGGNVGRRIPVRLVKGAYWDSEIKQAQEAGLSGYPVFTRKRHTDVAYLACARAILSGGERMYAQFATHNAHTLASILHFAGDRSDYEFQRLHGMGEDLYSEVIDAAKYDRACRVYAPVGSHEDLLPYLVRRLLENGANTSFVNRIVDENVHVDDIVADPVELSRKSAFQPHPVIPAPERLFGDERRNSRGYNLADPAVAADLLDAIRAASGNNFEARPVVGGDYLDGSVGESRNPADGGDLVGLVREADGAMVDRAIDLAIGAQPAWDRRGAAERAGVLERAADLFEDNAAELLGLCVREAGKTVPDSIAELREAVDFLRYYASQARREFGEFRQLPGPTGERNLLGYKGRGVFVCISPWNFPLAIFTGQVAAALAAGNAVIAKPAEQTPITAFRAVELLLEAGVPGNVLHFLPGDGATVGGRAVASPKIAGVAFTGSTETARLINQSLAAKPGPIAVLIAETGGQNAMFVDSSALPEQVVLDAVYSAFNSAGQRCSALRLLCIQSDIADRVIELLRGSMRELVIGRPSDLATDVGPVIDADAQRMLSDHVDALLPKAGLIHRCELPEAARKGTYFAPAALEIPDISLLRREVFGPVLHVYRYKGRRMQHVVEAVNATGYGLTMGLHSRIDRRAREFAQRSGAGNVYINRNMIGAVVGVQPFGGRGLSGTGPKAGGPNYLHRFATEICVSNNIAAVGGNASLLSLAED